VRGARDLPPLSPRGTARQRLSPASTFSAELAAELRDAGAHEGLDAERGDEGITLAWQLTQWADDHLGAPARATLLSLFARTLGAVAQGSTRLAVDREARAWLAAAPALVGGPGHRRPFILDGEYLYPQRLAASEDRLVAALAARLRRPPLFAAEDIERAAALVATGDAEGAPRPSEEQRAVVRAALGGRLAVVTGGPGTGKTSVVVSLVRALVGLGVRPQAIALAAPTGRAANRLEEALGAVPRLAGPRAETLHRLLGYAPRAGAFMRGEHHRLAQRAVIVDEGSMIDLLLMERLVSAVADDALLVILGDADQLPSVEAGAVFRDLHPLAVRLTRSFRVDPDRGEGRRILELARALRAGDTAVLGSLLDVRADAGAVTFSGAELAPAAALPALLDRWYAERVTALPDFTALAGGVYHLGEDGVPAPDQIRLATLHRHFQSFRLLCLTHGRATGADACNAWLHRRHAGTEPGPAPGEPILMIRNDHDRGLWNGDQGLVVRVREGTREPRPMALFPVGGSWNAFDLDSLRDMAEPAHAMTVHKAQGSEYDDVALLLPDEPIPLLSRELLYTALTRSRRSVVVCGSAAVLAAGATRPLVRSSGVADKLRTALAQFGYSAAGP
jgi:exodeoxyribonuclease V alpha subunit